MEPKTNQGCRDKLFSLVFAALQKIQDLLNYISAKRVIDSQIQSQINAPKRKQRDTLPVRPFEVWRNIEVTDC